MRLLLLLIAVILCCSCTDRVQSNPGARVPVYVVTAQYLDLHWPRGTHPELRHDGDLVGLYVPTPTPAIYIVRGKEWILPHELAHLVDDLHGSYWDALHAISCPTLDLYQDRQ